MPQRSLSISLPSFRRRLSARAANSMEVTRMLKMLTQRKMTKKRRKKMMASTMMRSFLEMSLISFFTGPEHLGTSLPQSSLNLPHTLSSILRKTIQRVTRTWPSDASQRFSLPVQLSSQLTSQTLFQSLMPIPSPETASSTETLPMPSESWLSMLK